MAAAVSTENGVSTCQDSIAMDYSPAGSMDESNAIRVEVRIAPGIVQCRQLGYEAVKEKKPDHIRYHLESLRSSRPIQESIYNPKKCT